MAEAFDYRQAAPEPTGWFDDQPTYQGWGRAEFSSPRALIEGSASAEIGPTGRITVTLRVERSTPEAHHGANEARIISGYSKSEWVKASEIRFERLASNPCVRLTVRTSRGTLTGKPTRYSCGWSRERLTDGFVMSLTFSLPRAAFHSHSRARSAYWVMPLSNFVPYFAYPAPELDWHPLRMRRKRRLPRGLTRAQRIGAAQLADQFMRTILLRGAHLQGFIDPLPDFAEREEALKSASAARLITSVMVGGVPSVPQTLEVADESRLLDLSAVLGLASGNHVGSPWIEVRSKKGVLLRRLHVSSWFPGFAPGRPTIDHLDGGAGPLLEGAMASGVLGEPFMRATLFKLVRSQARAYSVEDRCVDVFTAVDGLCIRFDLKKSPKIRELVSSETRRELAAIATETQQRLEKLLEAVQKTGDSRECEAVAEIARQAKQLQSLGPIPYGRSVSALLRRFELADETVMAQHYAQALAASQHHWPTGLPRDWFGALSRLRAKAVHDGHFDSSRVSPAGDSYFALTTHVTDILVRITLKILAYNGTYDPLTLPYRQMMTVDWVTPQTPASHLGYSLRNPNS